MNVNLLYHQIMNQLGGHHLPGSPYPRYPESLLKQHQARVTEIQNTVSASLAQLKPYDLASRSAASDQFEDRPQDLSLRYPPGPPPPPLGYSPLYPGHIKREPSPSPQPQVKTEPPEDPGYSLQELGSHGQAAGGHHSGHQAHQYPGPPPDLCRSYSLPARDPSDQGQRGHQRPASLDRGQGPSTDQAQARAKGEITTARTIIGTQRGGEASVLYNEALRSFQANELNDVAHPAVTFSKILCDNISS